MQRYGPKHRKCQLEFFFTKPTLSLLYPYGALTSCKKLEKTNARSLRYLKTITLTDRRTDRHTDGQGQLLRTPSGKTWVKNQNSASCEIFYFFLYILAKLQDSSFTVAKVISQIVILNKSHFCKKGIFCPNLPNLDQKFHIQDFL